MDIFLRISEKFPISDIFRVGPYNRFGDDPDFKRSYRIYFDQQKAETSIRSKKGEDLKTLILDEFSKALGYVGIDSTGYAFVVWSSSKDSSRSLEDIIPNLKERFEFDQTKFIMDETYFTVWGFVASKTIIFKILNLFINRFVCLDGDDFLNGDFFVANESLDAVINVYDDRGMDVIIHG
ncbi:DUF3885 domain-containing protein [Saccharospirillum impatiens]|uniref:DUF3885 domain-containing protein n=1 Tax=Saccharospirillum impatiens TaxID=169438 RepID=UPI00048C40B0|nr:hypothetical protein [Saccharospirillum impatiens]